MEEIVVVRERQRVLHTDTMDLQAAVRATLDEMLKQAVGGGLYYSGFAASETGNWEVTLGPGRLYLAGKMYRNLANTVLSDAVYNLRPIAQKRMLAVVGYGQDIETTPTGAPAEPRQFVVNTTTRETEVQQVATRSVRYAKIDLVSGVEQASPVAPAIGAGSVLIATILLDATNGVEAVTMNPAALLPQVARNAEAIATLNEFLEIQGLRIDTLVSDLAAIKSQLANFATKEELAAVRAIAEEALAKAKEALTRADDLDTDARFLRTFSDDYATDRLSDTGAAGYSCRVQSGLRFPAAATASLTNGIETFLSVEPKVVKNLNSMMLPAFTNRLRLDTFGPGKLKYSADLQSYTSATHSITTLEPSRTELRYDSYQGEFDGAAPGGTLPFTFFGVSVPAYPSFANVPMTPELEAWVKARQGNWPRIETSSRIFNFKVSMTTGVTGAMPQLYYRFTLSYLAPSNVLVPVSSSTIDGQGRAQTFLQERDGWLTRIGLYFTEKGASGDVKVGVVELDDSGAPRLNTALVIATIPYASIKKMHVSRDRPEDETVVDIPPVLLTGGKRYAITVVSTGAHAVRLTADMGPVTQGEHWALSDANKWEKPVLERPSAMTMRLYFARFASTEITVDLKPLSLAGGMKDVAVNAVMVKPALTGIDFEVQPTGAAWQVLGPTSGQRVAADFSSNPELVPLRVVFRGTLDIMPALSFSSSKSTVTASRAATALTHFSQTIDVGSGNTSNLVRVMHRLRSFNDTPHDFTVTLVKDPHGTPANETADAVTDETLADGSILRTSVFQFTTGVRYFKIKSVGAAASNAALFHSEGVEAAFFTV